MEYLFVDFSVKKLNQLTSRIEDCMSRLDENQVWQRGSQPENSAGNLLLHLNGNVSQWILKGVGNRPYDRDRDAEFAATGGVSKDELVTRLRQTIASANEVIGGLTRERLTETVRIQYFDVSVCEAVYHVVEHFSQHVGQIMFLTKLFTSNDLGYYKTIGTGTLDKTP